MDKAIEVNPLRSILESGKCAGLSEALCRCCAMFQRQPNCGPAMIGCGVIWEMPISGRQCSGKHTLLFRSRSDCGTGSHGAARRCSGPANLSLYCAKLGQKQRAEHELALGQKKPSTDPEFLYTSALVYEFTGQREKALSSLRSTMSAGYPLIEIQSTPDLVDCGPTSVIRNWPRASLPKQLDNDAPAWHFAQPWADLPLKSAFINNKTYRMGSSHL